MTVNLHQKLFVAISLLMIVVELSPLNELIRYGLFAASLAANASPLSAALILTLSTAIIEFLAALSFVYLVMNAPQHGIMDRLRQRAKSYQLNSMSPWLLIGLTYVGGLAIALCARYLFSKDWRPKRELIVAAYVQGIVCAVLFVQGYLLAYGIDTPGTFGVGLALVSIAGAIAIIRSVQAKSKKQKT